MEKKLSIFMPVYNEASYIKQCITSLQSNISEQFEVILSDNHSNDGTYEILQSINDSRFKIVRPAKKLSPQKHHWYAFNHCQGEYVFFIGGDDYFENRIIDIILPNLQNNKIIIGQMRCFSDIDGATINTTNKSENIRKKIFLNDEFINNYLNQISHDEIMYAFIPKKLLKNGHLIFANCLETLLPWMGILLFGDKFSIKEMVYLNKIVFHKRKNKLYVESGSFAKEAYGTMINGLFVLKSINSLINCFIYILHTRNFYGFLKLLFKTRSMERPKTLKGGFWGLGGYGKRRWYFGPALMIFLGPILDLLKAVKYLLPTRSR